MAKKLTSDKTREARRLLISAALDLTKLRRKMRTACIMVLLDGRTQSEAARRIQRSRKTVSKALAAVRPKLDEVQRAFDEAAR